MREPAIDMETPIRFLREDGRSPYHDYAWPLPKDGGPGEWTPYWDGPLGCGEDGGGYFACKPEYAVRWIDARAFTFEADGEIYEGSTKFCCRRARLMREFDTWNDQTKRLLACEYAEAVLPIFEREYPGDMCPRNYITVSRRYAFGLADDTVLREAASAASATITASEIWAIAAVAAARAARAAGMADAAAAAWAAEEAEVASATRTAVGARVAAASEQSALLMRVLYDDGSWLREQREKVGV